MIRELLRITAPGGFVMIHAWAKEQGEDSKHNFPDSVREKLSFDNYLFFYSSANINFITLKIIEITYNNKDFSF